MGKNQNICEDVGMKITIDLDKLVTIHRLAQQNKVWGGVQGYIYHGIHQIHQEKIVNLCEEMFDEIPQEQKDALDALVTRKNDE